MSRLTTTQSNLLAILDAKVGYRGLPFRNLKSIANVPSFDTSFNALVKAGYYEAVETHDLSNSFKRTMKKEKVN